MNTRRLALLLSLSCGLLAVAPALRAAPAPLDLNELRLAVDTAAETVEVNLNAALLSVGARLVEVQDAEAARLLRGLSLVQVRVHKLGEAAVASALDQIEQIRSNLGRAGWQQAVSVRDPKGANVAVHVRLRGDEAIEGLVVTVLGERREAVLVNIVGDIRPEQLAKLGERLNIQPLRELKLGAPAVEAGKAGS